MNELLSVPDQTMTKEKCEATVCRFEIDLFILTTNDVASKYTREYIDRASVLRAKLLDNFTCYNLINIL